MSEQANQIIDAINAAWNARDVDMFISLMADNVELHDKISNKRHTSKEDIKAHVSELFRALTNPTRTVTNKVVGSGGEFAIEWTMSCNYTNQSPLLPIPAEGQDIKMVGASFYSVDENGKIVRQTNYGSIVRDPPK